MEGRVAVLDPVGFELGCIAWGKMYLADLVGAVFVGVGHVNRVLFSGVPVATLKFELQLFAMGIVLFLDKQD